MFGFVAMGTMVHTRTISHVPRIFVFVCLLNKHAGLISNNGRGKCNKILLKIYIHSQTIHYFATTIDDVVAV